MVNLPKRINLKISVAHGRILKSNKRMAFIKDIGPGKFGKKNKRRALNTHVLCSK